MDEILIKEITRRVIEELQKSNAMPLNTINNADIKGKSDYNPKEVVVGVGPAFFTTLTKTLNGLKHLDVIKEVMAGIEEEGMIPKVIKVYKTSDVAFIGKEAAKISGSGVAIGLQSKGTAIIHHRDLYPLSNLELFPQAPMLTLKMYRSIGKNAARYAAKVAVTPINVENDYMVRPKYQVKAALMHMKETEEVEKDRESVVLSIKDIKGL